MFYSFNSIDGLIFLFVLIYAILIFKRGFLVELFEFIGFLLSLFSAIFIFPFPSSLLQAFSVPTTLANTISFLAVWIVVELFSITILRDLFKKIPMSLILSKFNRYWGILPNLLSSLTIVVFIGIFALVLPTSASLKTEILQSRILETFLPLFSQVNHPLEDAFSQSVRAGLVLVNKNKESDFLKLNFPKVEAQIDISSESALLSLTNKFRSENSLPSLSLDTTLTLVARRHSLDMFERSYFGHSDPDGKTPLDRVKASSLNFAFLGENVSYAPDVDTAEIGFLNSQGHRENILNPRFKRIGIGVARSSYYGRMFTEEFTD